MDRLALGSGLRRDEGHADHPPRFGSDLLQRFDHLDAATLAASAGVDLGLDHPDRTAQPLGDLDGFLGRARDAAAQDRDAEILEQLFGLMFVNVHLRHVLIEWRENALVPADGQGRCMPSGASAGLAHGSEPGIPPSKPQYAPEVPENLLWESARCHHARGWSKTGREGLRLRRERLSIRLPTPNRHYPLRRA